MTHMRSFLRSLLQFRHLHHHHRRRAGLHHTTISRRMSSSGTITAMLTATVAQTPRPGIEPEEAKERRHHLKDGKGFTNPWDSWGDLSASKIVWGLLKHAILFADISV